VKLLTEFHDNPKVLGVGLAGAGLYARSLAYCGKYETDGLIPASWVRQAVGAEGLGELPKHLLGAGLWKKAESSESDYEIRDYLDVNPSKEDLASLRKTRSVAGRRGGLAKAKAKAKQKGGKSNSYSYSPSSSVSSVVSVAVRTEFNDWLKHYREITGRTSVRGSETAQKAFAARRKQWSLEELKQATVGCHSDPWRVEHAHDVPDTILRAKNVEGYIQAGRTPKAVNDPTARQNARLQRLEEMKRQVEGEDA